MDVGSDPVPEAGDAALRRRIGERVRAVRQARDLTQRELAARASIGVRRVGLVEEGRSLATIRSLVALAAALDVGVEVLTGSSSLLDLAGLPLDRGTTEDHWRTFAPLVLDDGLRAAAGMFAEVGFHATTLETVAARAGMSTALLREHHRDLQGLLQATYAILIDDLRARTSAALREADGPLQQFTNAVECLTLHHAHRRALSFVAQTEMRHLEPRAHERIRALRVAEQRTVDATVLRGVAAGVFTTARPHEAARAVVSLSVGVSHWFNADGPDTAAQVARQQVDFALALVGHTTR